MPLSQHILFAYFCSLLLAWRSLLEIQYVDVRSSYRAAPSRPAIRGEALTVPAHKVLINKGLIYEFGTTEGLLLLFSNVKPIRRFNTLIINH